MRLLRDTFIVIFMCGLTLAVVEGFFRINEVAHFITPKPPPYPPASLSNADFVKTLVKDLPRVPREIEQHTEPSLLALTEDDLTREFVYPSGISFKDHKDFQSKLQAKDGRVIYDVAYTFDSEGRRKVSPAHEHASKFVITVGDSFTWGEGVRQDLNYPSQLAKILPDAHVYNEGFPGTGPNDDLDQMEEVPKFYTGGIRERSGSVIYLFIPAHFDRLVAGMRVVRAGPWALRKPAYLLEEGRLTKHGTLADAHPWRVACLRVIGASAFARFFGLDGPSAATPESAALFAAVMSKMRALYAASLKIDQFYFVLWPGTPAYVTQILYDALPADQFTIVDLSTMNPAEFTDGEVEVPVDHHPNGAAYWVIAHALARVIANDSN